MKNLWHNIRCMIAERYFGFALAIVPKGTDEQLAVILAIRAYKRTLELKGLLVDEAVIKMIVETETRIKTDATRR